MMKLYVKINNQYKEVSAVAYGNKIAPLLKTKIHSALEMYLKEYTSKKSKATRTNENTYFNVFSEFMCLFKIDFIHEITPEHIQQFKTHLLKTKSPATVNRQFNTFKNFFAVLVKKQLLYLNPCSNIQAEKTKKPKITLWTRSEFDLVLDHLDHDMKCIMEFFWLSGARNIEAVDLVWTDVDQENGTITLRSQKSRDHFRRIPITDKMSRLLHRLKFKGIYVFGGGSKFTSDSIGKRLKKAVLAAGVSDKLTVYSVRHTFCKDLLAAGLSRPMVQELMGHQDWRTTENYSHWETSNLRKAIGSIR